MASKILNTARTLYAENEAESMGSAVKQAVHAHISSAIHPTNVIGKAFGYGSFAHTIARRYISGEPEFEPGGIKNPFKSDLKRKKGEKADGKKTDPKTSAKIAIQAEQAVKSGRTDVVMLRTLGQVDVNTRQTNSYLQDIVEGNAKLAGTAEETAAEAKNADDQQTAALVKAMMGLGKSGDGAALAQASNGFLGNIGTGLEMGVGSAAGTAVAGALGGVVSKLGIYGLMAAMIGNGIYQGIEEWNKTGDLGKALYAALDGLTFGIAGAMADGLKQGVTDLRKDVKDGKALTSDPMLNAKIGGWGTNQAAQQQRASTQLMDDSAGRAWDKEHRWGMGMISSNPFDASTRPKAKPMKVYGRAKPRKPSATVAPAAPKYTEGGMTGLHGVSPAVPPEGARLLDAIAGSESPGYNVINGGGRFTDMSDHPFASTNKATGYGLAAGRYQFMPATWNEYKAKLGLTDFSPGSQDIAAWALAQDRYAANTRGRNLQADLNDPSKSMLIGQALHSTWTSLPGGAERNSKTDSFAARLAGGGGGASASADYSTVTQAQASVAAATGLDVVAMTAATQAMARQQATVSGDTQFEMANAPVDGPSSGPNFNVMGASGGSGDVTASSGLSGSSTEGIDDIISKVLVAMGAVTQT